MIYIPILGALSLAVGTIIQKRILRKRKIGIKTYMTAEFLAIVLAMLPFIYFFWKLDAQALEFKNIFIFSLIILFSIIANLLMLYSLKWEKISNLEPARILEPLFIILLAIFFSFFAEELYDRNIKVIIPALIAGLALIFSHIRRDHLEFSKYFIAAILASFFFALELVISRLILDYYSPISFYFLRCSVILLIALVIFRPKYKSFNKKVGFEILLVGIVWTIYRVVVYYGYLELGVVFTTLIIMLGPIFIYFLAWKFLKEKVSWKNIAASIIIIGCVVYALLA
jgi:drug/metabolite transporter (DMT)-like permease